MTGGKKYLIGLLLALFALQARAQQTIQFSQYVFNGLALNPAYAGYKDDLTLNMSGRLQWVGISGSPQTATASIDGLTNSTDKNVGLGFLATVDHLGPEATTSAYLNYSYRLRLDALDTKRLCFGIGAGIIQYNLFASQFNATDVGDGEVPTSTLTNYTPDFRFGIYYYTPTFYLGASVFNLLTGTSTNVVDNIEIIKQVRTFYITGGAMIPVGEDIDIKPTAMIKEDFQGPTNLDIGGYVVFNKTVWVGTSYRTGVDFWNSGNLQSGLEKQDAVAAIVQFNINDHFRIGYSYDFTVSQLQSYQNGSHEISISIGFPTKKQRVVSPRYF